MTPIIIAADFLYGFLPHLVSYMRVSNPLDGLPTNPLVVQIGSIDKPIMCQLVGCLENFTVLEENSVQIKSCK